MSGPWRPALCASCSEPLTPHQRAGGYCAAPPCAQAKLRAGIAKTEAARAERRAAAAQAAIDDRGAAFDAALSTLGVARAETVVGGTPALDRPLAPADPVAQERFLAALDAHLAAAFAVEPGPGEQGRAVDAPPSADMSACCRLCRGWCCLLGAAANAFLSADDLIRQRRREPALTAAALRARYVAAMPAQAVEGSCVFHGVAGCGLSREMRATVCNAHQCRAQDAVAAALTRAGGGPAARALALVAFDGDEALRVAVLGREDGRFIPLGDVGGGAD